VLTTDGDAWRGIYQNVAVTEGLTYAAGTYIRAVGVETSSSWLEVQWLDSSGGVLSQHATTAITADQPFLLSSLHDIVAPAGAVTASVRGVVHMPSAPAVDADFHNFEEFYFLRPVDLSITLTASTNVVGADQLITYTLMISNRSASMSGSYFITNDLTTNLTFVSATDGGVASGTMISWALFGLPGGMTTNVSVTATQPYFTGSTQEFSHAVSAAVSSGIGDPVPGNNTAGLNTITVGVPLLTLMGLCVLAAVIAAVSYRRHRRTALTAP
jgi:hypothetical protein